VWIVVLIVPALSFKALFVLLQSHYLCLYSFITVQASIPSNTYVVSGSAENRRIEELIPGILSQLGPESMDYLRSYADMMKAAAAGAGGVMDSVEEGEEEDDEVPDLVENFEEAAAK
jgi:nascent polypeptide-associated complex subunit beta